MLAQQEDYRRRKRRTEAREEVELPFSAISTATVVISMANKIKDDKPTITN